MIGLVVSLVERCRGNLDRKGVFRRSQARLRRPSFESVTLLEPTLLALIVACVIVVITRSLVAALTLLYVRPLIESLFWFRGNNRDLLVNGVEWYGPRRRADVEASRRLPVVLRVNCSRDRRTRQVYTGTTLSRRGKPAASVWLLTMSPTLTRLKRQRLTFATLQRKYLRLIRSSLKVSQYTDKVHSKPIRGQG